ncbi:hypothetical protein QBC34DRAFT_36152 [Podospora aff. communis PSN243]|uniref:Uncharacterized protein n=1 Tax=Podospora aff. communis PSN243 TaxID=3040156 RepID=A0AAV9GWQ6_9PEZI|nr:hypothetical protein QBC34DRAFT_36152 [Podospora aff. communis PSN243]
MAPPLRMVHLRCPAGTLTARAAQLCQDGGVLLYLEPSNLQVARRCERGVAEAGRPKGQAQVLAARAPKSCVLAAVCLARYRWTTGPVLKNKRMSGGFQGQGRMPLLLSRASRYFCPHPCRCGILSSWDCGRVQKYLRRTIFTRGRGLSLRMRGIVSFIYFFIAALVILQCCVCLGSGKGLRLMASVSIVPKGRRGNGAQGG